MLSSLCCGAYIAHHNRDKGERGEKRQQLHHRPSFALTYARGFCQCAVTVISSAISLAKVQATGWEAPVVTRFAFCRRAEPRRP